MTATRLPSSQPSAGDRSRCAREILDTVPLLMRVLRAEVRRQGAHVVSIPQFRVLAFVRRHPGASLAAVAEHLGVAAPTASTIVGRLVQRGLLAREAAPRERRRVVLTLTASGTRLLARLRNQARRRVAARLAGTPAADLRRITGALAALGRLFREEVRGDG